MNFTWQDVVVMVLVVAAGGFVALRIWRLICGRRSGGCCNCSCSGDGKKRALVDLDPPLTEEPKRPF